MHRVKSNVCYYYTISTMNSVLSATAAIADLGFNHTLGEFNVMNGASVHKTVIKNNYFTPSQLNSTAGHFRRYIDTAVSDQLSRLKDQSCIPDFISFIRKVVLSTIIDDMLGSKLLKQYHTNNGRTVTNVSPAVVATESDGRGDFIEDFIALQDGIEDATATATVLPDWLALPTCLWAAASRREKLTRRLVGCLQALWIGGDEKLYSTEDFEG